MSLIFVVVDISLVTELMLKQGPHPLYKPTKGKIVPPLDSFCLEMQRNLNNKYCDSCQQCDYEIEYADQSSSMGVLVRDEMHLVIANGDRAKVTFMFGYNTTTSRLCHILLFCYIEF